MKEIENGRAFVPKTEWEGILMARLSREGRAEKPRRSGRSSLPPQAPLRDVVESELEIWKSACRKC